MSDAPRDYFDRARVVAVGLLVVAAGLAITGSFLNWVTITPPERIPAEQAHRLQPFAGVDTTDGWIVIVAATTILVSAVLMLLRGRSTYAWIAFWASVVVGGIAIADYRGIEGLFYDEMHRIGEPDPGLGITLVAVAGLIGVIGAVAGVAATPTRD